MLQQTQSQLQHNINNLLQTLPKDISIPADYAIFLESIHFLFDGLTDLP